MNHTTKLKADRQTIETVMTNRMKKQFLRYDKRQIKVEGKSQIQRKRSKILDQDVERCDFLANRDTIRALIHNGRVTQIFNITKPLSTSIV